MTREHFEQELARLHTRFRKPMPQGEALESWWSVLGDLNSDALTKAVTQLGTRTAMPTCEALDRKARAFHVAGPQRDPMRGGYSLRGAWDREMPRGGRVGAMVELLSTRPGLTPADAVREITEWGLLPAFPCAHQWERLIASPRLWHLARAATAAERTVVLARRVKPDTPRAMSSELLAVMVHAVGRFTSGDVERGTATLREHAAKFDDDQAAVMLTIAANVEGGEPYDNRPSSLW